MKPRRYQLLRQLAFRQFSVVLVGIVGLAVAYFVVTRQTFRKAMESERAKVRLSLDEQQNKWRTWKQLGLDEALRHELVSHSKVFALAKLEVVPVSALPSDLAAEEVAIPDPAGLPADALVVYARLNPDHIEAAYVPYRSNLILLGLCGLLFGLVILSSIRFIRRNIYVPFQELRGVFEDINAGKALEDEKRIAASGEIREFIVSLVELYKKLKENEKNAAMVTVAKQVAHDIRSPLSALDMILDTLPQLPEQKRLIIRGALGRIRDIANNVLERSRRSMVSGAVGPSPEALLDIAPATNHSIASLLEEIMTEKQVIAREKPGVDLTVRIDDDAYALFAQVSPATFKTLLSNLVNNAIEAIPESGSVSVSLQAEDREILLTVRDTGKGIAPHILEILRTSGGTFGKADGMGLGLTHARATMERWGGKLDIESQVGAGTSVLLRLPRLSPPRWFVPAIEVPEGRTVLILDDDPSIHLVWQQRFNDAMKHADAGVFLEHFSDPASLRRWCAENPRRTQAMLFLCDYEIVGSAENGIDLIRSLGVADRAVLVTGRYDEEKIRARCEVEGIRLLPKGLGGCVPVRVRKQIPLLDAILVDDDPLVHMTWDLAAKAAGKRLRGFYSVEKLLESVEEVDASTPVYVDRNLGTDEKGEAAARYLVQAGFTQVFLATGDEPEEVGNEAPWLAGVRGKNPPWSSPLPT